MVPICSGAPLNGLVNSGHCGRLANTFHTQKKSLWSFLVEAQTLTMSFRLIVFNLEHRTKVTKLSSLSSSFFCRRRRRISLVLSLMVIQSDMTVPCPALNRFDFCMLQNIRPLFFSSLISIQLVIYYRQIARSTFLECFWAAFRICLILLVF